MLPPSGPDWMSELPEELWDVPLTDLAIPGTNLEAFRKRGGVILTDTLLLRFVFRVMTFSLRSCLDRLEVLLVIVRNKDVKIKSQRMTT